MTDSIEPPSAAPITHADTSDKAIVFAALAEAGIHRATVDYDGGDDSGQIENIEAWNAGNERNPVPGR
jgi:uncharacterized protein DUF6878